MQYGAGTYWEYCDRCVLMFHSTLSLPFVRRTATDEFKMFNNISHICMTVSKTFNPKVPADAQIAAAEVIIACMHSLVAEITRRVSGFCVA
eukprot:1189888-Prorocentrum_minimum.AAC.6